MLLLLHWKDAARLWLLSSSVAFTIPFHPFPFIMRAILLDIIQQFASLLPLQQQRQWQWQWTEAEAEREAEAATLAIRISAAKVLAATEISTTATTTAGETSE